MHLQSDRHPKSFASINLASQHHRPKQNLDELIPVFKLFWSLQRTEC